MIPPAARRTIAA